MAHPPALTLEITSSGNTVRVYGKRSTKGWKILRTDGAHSETLGHRDSKKAALQLAQDCCEPGLNAIFTVKPANA